MTFILVADDDAMFRAIAKRHLERLGFDVLEEESGKRVANQVLNYQPVACLIDIFMDEKEGIETIGEITRMVSRPKIIAVSSSSIYLDAALGLGADAALRKPVTFDALKSELDHLGVSAS